MEPRWHQPRGEESGKGYVVFCLLVSFQIKLAFCGIQFSSRSGVQSLRAGSGFTHRHLDGDPREAQRMNSRRVRLREERGSANSARVVAVRQQACVLGAASKGEP